MSNNLDALINKISFEIVNQRIVDENEINKMLGVLVNDGVYAWWVYAKSKLSWNFTEDKEKFKLMQLINFLMIISQLNSLFSEHGEIISENKIENLCNIQKEINNLQKEIRDLSDKSKKANTKTEKETINRNKQQKKDEKKQKIKEQGEIFNSFFNDISNNLSDLLFFREILEKILIYARYHAKAMGD